MRGLVALVVVALALPAHADHESGDGTLANWLIGPVLGVRLGGPPGSRLIVGIEGGAGIGPERINLGFQNRLDKMFYYVELDPWYIVGGSFGVGIDEDGKTSGIIGVWEGLPLNDLGPACSGWHRQLTLAGGYRYTGVHELYVTLKAGMMDGSICF